MAKAPARARAEAASRPLIRIVRVDRDGDPLPTELPPDQLEENPRNWRRHPETQMAAIKGSVERLGYIAGATVNLRYPEDGWPEDSTPKMLDGHGRQKNALRNGHPSMPVTFVRLDPTEEAEALLLFDPITGLAIGDPAVFEELARDAKTTDEALAGLISDTFAELTSAFDASDGDDQNDESDDDGDSEDAGEDDNAERVYEKADELQEKWGVQAGDLWLIDGTADNRRHRIYCGDATDPRAHERLFAGKQPAIVITDPPYNVELDYSAEVDDGKTADAYAEFTARWVDVWTRQGQVNLVVTPGLANLALWLGRYAVKHVAPWVKTNGTTRGYVAQFFCWEPIVYLGSKFLRKRPNDVFSFPISGRQSDVGVGDLRHAHPCPKPIKFWLELVTSYTEEGELVGEPFGGSGTTLVACEELGRTCYATELTPKFVAVCLERLSARGCRCRRA